jgi:hypothetical protein
MSEWLNVRYGILQNSQEIKEKDKDASAFCDLKTSRGNRSVTVAEGEHISTD